MEAQKDTVGRLFGEALALPAGERDSFLGDTCDEGMRRELTSLLAAYEEASGFFERLADSLVAPAWDGLQQAETTRDPLNLEDRQVGRYVIEAHLGGGGMGVVYRARDTRLGRPVALKFLSPHLAASEEAGIRFVREARATSALDHSNIATIYEIATAPVGPSERTRRFIAMAYYDGLTLKKKIEQGPLSVEAGLDYAMQITDGLRCAHEAGIVHRDVKPANVIVTEQDVVKLVDFGLAKAAAASQLTDPGRRLGTAAYMSPEQARGEDVDARTDLWSVGVLLYEMATGARPFHRGRETATLYAVLHEEPASAHTLRPDLPRGVEQIIAGCLAKDRDARYPTAEALLNDLRAVRRGEAPAHSGVEPSRAHATDRTIAVLPFETLGAQEATTLTRGIHGDVLTRLSNVADLQVISRTSVRKYRSTEKTIREIGRELRAAWVLEGEVQEAADRVQVNARLVNARMDRQVWAKDYRRKLSAEKLFEIQGEITKNIAGSLKTRLSPEEKQRIEHKPTENLAAYRLHAQGRRRLDQRTETGMRKAVEHFRRATEHDPSYALAWAGLADALTLLYDYGYEDADHALPQAEETVLRALELDPDLAEAHASLGLLHSNRHEGSAAIRELKRAVELRPDYAEAHNWLSWNYKLLGKAEEALASAKRAVELDPLSPEVVSNLSFSNLVNGETEKALREARRMQEIEPDFPSGPFLEGLALYHLGRFEEAKSVLRNLAVPWAGSGPPATLALAHAASGDSAGARELLAQLQEAPDASFATGLIYAALGDEARAFDAFERVEYWDDWPTIAMHHLYPDILGPLREDARFEAVLNEVNRARRLAPDAPRSASSQRPSGAAAGAEVRNASIAVLPFDTLGREGTDPFTEGAHDDLLTRLAALSGIEVTSRTSVMPYRNAEKSLRTIARELGVAWVLEGSAQRFNDQVRVRVRLVNARTDRQAWAEDYRRELTAENLFRMQGEITRKIARALKARLTPEEKRRMERHPTDDLDAYRFYVQGRGHLHERSEHSMHRAVDYFRRAIEQDAEYALAWAGLADALSIIEFYDFTPPETALDPMEAAQRAVALAPDLGEAHASLGIVHSIRQEGPAMLRELSRAVKLQPSHAEAYVWLGWAYLVAGRPKEALNPEKRAVELNPLAPAYRVFLAEAHLANGEVQEALREARRAREIQPQYGLAHFMEGLVLHHLGRFAEAESALKNTLSLTLPPWGIPSHAMVRAALAATRAASDDQAGTRELLVQIEQDADPFSAGLIHAALGEQERAFEAFERVQRWGPIATEQMRYFFPDVLDPLRQDSRYEDLLRKVNRSWGLEAGLSTRER